MNLFHNKKKIPNIEPEKILKYFKIVPNNKKNTNNDNVIEEIVNKDNDELSKLKLNVSSRIFYCFFSTPDFIKQDKKLFTMINEYILEDPLELPTKTDYLSKLDESSELNDFDAEFISNDLPETEIDTSNQVTNSSTKVTESTDCEVKPIYRRRRPAFRNEYFYSISNMKIFNVIRYSFSSNYAQNFLKTEEGKLQVHEAIRNCRNFIPKAVPEEECVIPSKILLISQQNIKQAKRSSRKYRNYAWDRQLNQGIKLETL